MARSRVTGVRWIGRLHLASSFSSAARRSALRRVHEIALTDREHVESDERGRRFFRELLHARRRRVQPQLQRVEVEPLRRRRSRSRRRRRSPSADARAAFRAVPGNSGRAAASRGSGCTRRPCRGKRSPGIRPISARTGTRRQAARRRAWRASVRRAVPRLTQPGPRDSSSRSASSQSSNSAPGANPRRSARR